MGGYGPSESPIGPPVPARGSSEPARSSGASAKKAILRSIGIRIGCMTMKARRIMIGAGGVLLLLFVAAYLYVRSITPQLELGTGYAARVACACRYIGNRSLASCRTDFEPGMEPIRLSEDPAT